MAKASAPGQTKTRLVPPLTFDQAAALNTAFLQDIARNLLSARSHAAITGYVAFAPAGTEAFFHDTLPADIGLINACLSNFGDCLLHAVQEYSRADMRRRSSSILTVRRCRLHCWSKPPRYWRARESGRPRPIHRWGLLPARTENRASPLV